MLCVTGKLRFGVSGVLERPQHCEKRRLGGTFFFFFALPFVTKKTKINAFFFLCHEKKPISLRPLYANTVFSSFAVGGGETDGGHARTP